MGAMACARAVKAIAAAIALPFLSGCAGLHLDQGPDQVIQRTEGEDNYAQKQKAGPVAARVLPYALLAEQSYDAQVYATHAFTPRASACGVNGAGARIAPRAPTTNARPAGSRSGATSGVARVRMNAEFGPLGRARPSAAWGFKSGRARASDVPKLSSPFAEPSAATRETGNPTSTGSCALFPSTINTIRSVTISATSSAISKRDSCYRKGATELIAVGHSLGGGLAQLAAYSDRRIRRVYAFDPSMVTGFYSVDPPNRDRNVQGLGIERVYEFGEVLAYGRLIMLHTIPLSPCNPRVVSVRFRVFQGAPIALHSLTDLDNGLLRVARGSEPERSPMVLERCGATPPLVASR